MRVFLICLLALPPVFASAHPWVGSRDVSDHQIEFNVNAHGLLAFDLGYGYRTEAWIPNIPLMVYGRMTLPVALFPLDTVRFEAGLSGEWLSYESLGLVASASVLVGTMTQSSATFTTIGFDLSVMPGFYWPHGWVAVLVGWRQNLWTYISPSQIAADPYGDRYPASRGQSNSEGPGEGFVFGTGTRIPLGLAGGFSIGRHFSVVLEVLLTTAFNPFGLFLDGQYGLLPFDGELGIVVHFGAESVESEAPSSDEVAGLDPS